jgi:hypothetical protein
MPRLDAFDQEFEREEADAAGEQRRNTSVFRASTLIVLAFAAAVITALALGWPLMWGEPPAPSPAPSASSASENPEVKVARLTREVEALQQENRQLAQAQQEAADRIAALEAAKETSASFPTWYSDLAVLSYGMAAQEGAPMPRRAATARARQREVPRREEAGPVSLEPPR